MKINNTVKMLKNMDQGVFIGLVSLPYRANYDNNKKYLELLFNSYKDNLLSVSYTKNISPHLYKPLFYHVFGHYDLAVLSFVDDFLFGQQKFKPFSETALCNEETFRQIEFRNFSYQVHNCILSDDRQYNTAFIPNQPIALFGHFKIKSSLILGVGERAIEFTMQKAKEALKEGTEYFLLRTNSWQELVLIIFGTDPKEITKDFLKVRELITTVDEMDFSGSFVNDLYLGAEQAPFPLFSFVHSYFGVRYDLDESERIKYVGSLQLYTTFFVRPGYLNQLSEDLHKNITFGSGDMAIHATNYELLHSTSDKNNRGEGVSPIRKTKSTPQLSVSGKSYANKGQHEMSICFPKHSTDVLITKIGLPQKDVIKRIDDSLGKIKVDKAIKSRILKAIINFKDSIQDSALYSYFLDLYPFVHTIVNYVNELSADYHNQRLTLPLETVHKRLNELADVVEVAYRTRMQHSHRTLDMTDSTLEFSGGIHQVISAYDSIFKLFRKVLGYYRDKYEEDYTAIASLSSLPSISSDKYIININYLYLSQPEFFLATIFKESLNGILDIRLGTLERFPGKEIDLADVVDYIKGEYKRRLGNSESKLLIQDPNEQCHIQFLMLLSINETQIIAKTKKEIVNQIQRLNITVHQRWEMWEFALLLDKNLIEYFTYDFYNYKFFFNENYENYLFWVWHLFFQERGHYEVDGLLKVDTFLRLIFRTRFLIKSIENITDQIKADTYFEKIVKSYEPSKQLYMIKSTNFNLFFNFLFELNQDPFNNDTKLGSRIVNQIFHLSFIRSFNIRQSERGFKLLSYFMFSTTEGEEAEHFKFIVQRIQDYLNDIRTNYLPRSKNSQNDPGKENIIYRDYQTGKIMENHQGRINLEDGLYFDSGGGLFTVGSERSVYFTKRNLVMKDLISWSNKFKFEIYKAELKYTKTSKYEK